MNSIASKVLDLMPGVGILTVIDYLIELYTLALVTLCDSLPEHMVACAMCIYSMSHGDSEDMLRYAADLYQRGKAKYIVINGSDGEDQKNRKPGAAWPAKAVVA